MLHKDIIIAIFVGAHEPRRRIGGSHLSKNDLAWCIPAPIYSTYTYQLTGDVHDCFVPSGESAARDQHYTLLFSG